LIAVDGVFGEFGRWVGPFLELLGKVVFVSGLRWLV